MSHLGKLEEWLGIIYEELEVEEVFRTGQAEVKS